MRLIAMKVGALQPHLQVRPNEIDRCAGLSFRPMRTKDEWLLPTHGVPHGRLEVALCVTKEQQVRRSSETKTGSGTKFRFSGQL